MSADYVTTFEMQVEGDSETSGKLDSLAGKVKNVGDQGETAAKKTSNFTQTMKSSALGITAAASSATGLYFQYDNLEKVQTRVDKAEKTLTLSKATLISAQERMNDLVKDGITSGPDYEKAQLQLTAAQDGLGIATDRLHQSQGDLNQAQLGFALQVVPTVLTVSTTLTDVFGKLKLAKLGTAAATGVVAGAESAGTITRIAHTVATGAATIATGALTLATKLFHIAMGPVGWIILGVSTAMALFATNAFGIRDAINAAGKAVGDFFPILKPILDGLKYIADAIFPEAGKEAEAMQQTMTPAFTQIASEGSQQFDLLAENIDNSADKIVADAARINSAFTIPTPFKHKVKNISAGGGSGAAAGSPENFVNTDTLKNALGGGSGEQKVKVQVEVIVIDDILYYRNKETGDVSKVFNTR